MASFPAVSSAALISTSACDEASLTQPFKLWLDSSQYKLVPGGSFEEGASGWTFSHGATVVSGNQSFNADGSHSLYLPAGSSAESPPTCVNAAYPTFRLFARNSSLLSTVVVQVVYDDPIVGRVVLPVGVVALSKNWQPSLPMLTASAVQGVLKNGVAQVSLRFTAAVGSSSIDDVYVDPRLSH
ncbi:MAG TPA: hypothetical protein VK774_06565 [Solirubrobacteraceae bacterium]|nr:hypothetical protein [Solirubrobacteraceae bacterium]